MKLHELKSTSKYFESIWSTRRGLELRKNDRDFIAGDVLMCREFDLDVGKETGRAALLLVMHVLKADDILGLREGYVALTVKLLARTDQKGTKTTGTQVLP